jgi:replicative DNA helicase
VTPGVVQAGADEYHLNCIDYIGLMRSDAGGRSQEWQTLAGISNDLKLTASASHTCLLVASQINREGDSGSEPPRLSNLAGSDALGQDGDVVITMRKQPHNVGTAFSVEGNRHGEEGKFYTTFDLNTGAFVEISAADLEELIIDREQAA